MKAKIIIDNRKTYDFLCQAIAITNTLEEASNLSKEIFGKKSDRHPVFKTSFNHDIDEWSDSEIEEDDNLQNDTYFGIVLGDIVNITINGEKVQWDTLLLDKSYEVEITPSGIQGLLQLKGEGISCLTSFA
jgi:hypothetical protein